METIHPLQPKPVATNYAFREDSSKVDREKPTSVDEHSSEIRSKTVRFFDGIITSSIGVLFFGLPLFFTGGTLQGLAFEKQLFFYFLVLLGIVAWVLKGMIVGELKIRRTFLDIPIALFFSWYLLSAVLSIDRWRSFWGSFGDPSRSVLNVLAMVLAFYLVLSHFQPKRLYLWLGALVASSGITVVWSYLVFMGVHFLPTSLEVYAPVSLLGTTRALAFFLAAMIPLFIVSLMKLSAGGKVSKVFSVVLSIVLLATLALLAPLYHFVPWPAVLIGLGVLVIFILAKVVQPSENWVWLPLVVLGVVFFIVVFGEINFFKVNPPVEASPSTELSWVIIKDSLKSNFFFGSGPSTYAYDFSLYRPVAYNYNIQALSQFRFSQGQGILFEFLPTIGVIGSFFAMILVLMLVSFGFYVLSHNKEYNKEYSLGFWSTILILAVGAFIVPINSSLVALSALIIALGLATLVWESRLEDRSWNLSLRVSPKFALVSAFILLVASAGTIFLFAFIGKAFAADVFAEKAVVSLQKTGNSQSANDYMSRAMNLMPYESQYKVVLGQMYLSLATAEVNKAPDQRNLSNLTNYINGATQLLESAQQSSPKDIGVQESLAQVYESKIVLAGPSNELLDPLQKSYEQALVLEPNNPVFFLKLGQVHESRASILKDAELKAELQKAEDYFQQAIDKQSTYSPAYLNLALAKEMAGESKSASIDLLKKAASYDQQNTDIAYQLARMYRLRADGDDLKQAESIFLALLKLDPKNQNITTVQNIHINLGLLYEAMKRNTDAITQYQAVLDSVTGSDDTVTATRKQIQTLIDNVKAGKGNLSANTAPAATSVPVATPPTSGGQPNGNVPTPSAQPAPEVVPPTPGQ
ncbi:MAG: hypothetical protein WCG84_04580 [Candidatus Moraniibacteriota bacterium]